MSIISAAFGANPQLEERIRHAASDPNQSVLFHDISQHVVALQQEIRTLKRKLEDATSAQEPPEKRRKLPVSGNGVSVGEGAANTTTIRVAGSGWAAAQPKFCAEDLSFSMPVRKKLRLEVVAAGSEGGEGGIRGRNSSTGEDEASIAWSSIDQIICVPVPEKAQPSFNFIVLPKPGSDLEPVLWTVPGQLAKGVVFNDGGSLNEGERYESVIGRALNDELKKLNKRIVIPDANEFASAVVQAHRKDERAWHVKAWRGSKEGYLYFLGPGILFGFKKPLLFFPFSAIDNISYTSVLQRTFNLNITAVFPSGNNTQQEQEFEFAMLDQADFAGIDEYIKRHGLNDASLAESRRAKRFNINPASQATVPESNGVAAGGTDANGETHGPEEEESELARAERELQDAEDAEEEDYEVSGGETDGSGSSDEEEEEEEEGGRREEGEDGEEDADET